MTKELAQIDTSTVTLYELAKFVKEYMETYEMDKFDYMSYGELERSKDKFLFYLSAKELTEWA